MTQIFLLKLLKILKIVILNFYQKNKRKKLIIITLLLINKHQVIPKGSLPFHTECYATLCYAKTLCDFPNGVAILGVHIKHL